MHRKFPPLRKRGVSRPDVAHISWPWGNQHVWWYSGNLIFLTGPVGCRYQSSRYPYIPFGAKEKFDLFVPLFFRQPSSSRCGFYLFTLATERPSSHLFPNLVPMRDFLAMQSPSGKLQLSHMPFTRQAVIY